jgi:hypothetical protein
MIPTTELDLEKHPYIDFVPVSWYKVVGAPTGLGSLIVRKETLDTMSKTYFSGGTVTHVNNLTPNGFELVKGHAGYEDGTGNFRGWIQLYHQLKKILRKGPEFVKYSFRSQITDRLKHLTAYLAVKLPEVRWPSSSHPVVRIVGSPSVDDIYQGRQGDISAVRDCFLLTHLLGATMSMVFYDQSGRKIPLDLISKLAADAHFHIRVGCACNTLTWIANPAQSIDRGFGSDGMSSEKGILFSRGIRSIDELISDVGKRPTLENYLHKDSYNKDWFWRSAIGKWELDNCPPDFCSMWPDIGTARVSLGLPSRFVDVYAFHEFVQHIAAGLYDEQIAQSLDHLWSRR